MQLEWKIQGKRLGKRPVGTPGRWEDNIQMDLTEITLENENQFHLANDRAQKCEGSS
jgi:hypothetical protein